MLEKPMINRPPFKEIEVIMKEIEKETGSSDLGYEYEKVARNESFQKWFDGSKAVDENNKPLLMHNGSFLGTGADQSMGKKFESGYLATDGSERGRGALGAYFTSSSESIDALFDQEEGPGHQVWVHAFLKIKNPLYVPKGEDIDAMIDRMFPDAGMSWDQIKKQLREAGYDGIIQKHRHGYYDDEYVAFDQSQILMLPGQIDPEFNLRLQKEVELMAAKKETDRTPRSSDTETFAG